VGPGVLVGLGVRVGVLVGVPVGVLVGVFVFVGEGEGGGVGVFSTFVGTAATAGSSTCDVGVGPSFPPPTIRAAPTNPTTSTRTASPLTAQIHAGTQARVSVEPAGPPVPLASPSFSFSLASLAGDLVRLGASE